MLRTAAGAETVGYDTLIVGGGSKYNYFGHPEWQEHAAELKSLEGALHIRAQVLKAFETAEVTKSAEERDAPADVRDRRRRADRGRDGRADRRDRARHAARTSASRTRRRHGCCCVEGGDRVLATFPEKLSKRAFKSLVSLGVTPLLGHLVTGIDADGVTWKADGAE